MSRAIVEWVPIEDVLPNPLNPRKNDAIRTEEMQGIIKKRGWEEPLTVYKKGKVFYVLAGHRRLYAAKSAGVKQVPVFIVDAPKTHQEEIERIASLQSGRVDWTPFEWARFTYERWIAWGRPGLKQFSKDINLSVNQVKAYITVLDYFQIYEIEPGLKNGALNISALEGLVSWLRALKRYHPDLIEALTEDMVRRIMIEKMESKLATREGFKRSEYLQKATTAQVREYIQGKFTLEEAMDKVNITLKRKSFHGSLVSIGMLNTTISEINPATEEEAEKAFNTLTELKQSVENALKQMQKKNPELGKKDLFTW